MKKRKRPSLLVCVTGQYDCGRLIHAGSEIAIQNNYDLKVLCVLKPVKNYSILGSEFEYLHRTATSLHSDLMILFNDDAPKAAAQYAKKVGAKQLVTGMHDGRLDGFIFKFQEYAPNISITMISKENVITKLKASYEHVGEYYGV